MDILLSKEEIFLYPNETPHFIVTYIKNGMERVSLVKISEFEDWINKNNFTEKI